MADTQPNDAVVAPGFPGVARPTVLVRDACAATGLSPDTFRRLWREAGYPIWGTNLAHQRIALDDWRRFEATAWSDGDGGSE